jgi:hypothetical protein
VLVPCSLQLSLARAQAFASARLAFGAVRSVDELTAWLRKEAPARARELMRAVLNSKAPIAGAPVRVPVDASRASWH